MDDWALDIKLGLSFLASIGLYGWRGNLLNLNDTTLYNVSSCRWNIEEAYKLYKCRVKIEAFSGKRAKAVKQDIYAKAFMMTTMAVLASPIEEKIKRSKNNPNTIHQDREDIATR
jgi:hypothetical protein